MDTAMRARAGAAAVLAGAGLLLTAACGSGSAAAPAVVASPAGTPAGGPPAATRSAEDTVTGYLRAVDAHDAATARSYLAPECRRDFDGEGGSFEDWVADVVSVRLRSMPPAVTQTGLEGQFPAYRDLVEFGVTYDAVFRTPTASETSGPQSRFVVVGRDRARGVPLILEIGSGP